MDEIAVLVLNYTFEPLHFTNARRAITLLLAGKAEAVEASPRVVRSPSVTFALPAGSHGGLSSPNSVLGVLAFNKNKNLPPVMLNTQGSHLPREPAAAGHL